MTRALKVIGIILGVVVCVFVVTCCVVVFHEGPSTTEQGQGAPSTDEAQAAGEGQGSQPSQDRLAFIEHELVEDSFGYPEVQGRVQNTGQTTLTGVKVTVRWYATDGAVCGEDHDFSHCELRPGEIFRFQVSPWGLKYDEVGRYEITAEESWL